MVAMKISNYYSCIFSPEKQPEKPKEEEWADTPSEVYHLTDETFNTILESEPSALVMFYAPCKYVTVGSR